MYKISSKMKEGALGDIVDLAVRTMTEENEKEFIDELRTLVSKLRGEGVSIEWMSVNDTIVAVVASDRMLLSCYNVQLCITIPVIAYSYSVERTRHIIKLAVEQRFNGDAKEMYGYILSSTLAFSCPSIRNVLNMIRDEYGLDTCAISVEIQRHVLSRLYPEEV